MNIIYNFINKVIYIYTSNVNDAELLMPIRDLWFLMPSRNFRKKNEPEPS